MGQRQNFLENIVRERFGSYSHPKLAAFDIVNFQSIIHKTYLDLGGQFQEPPIRFDPWDISTKDFIIELDEERHFNRYRLRTLQSSFYFGHTLFQ